jgi:hypothetical protein
MSDDTEKYRPRVGFSFDTLFGVRSRVGAFGLPLLYAVLFLAVVWPILSVTIPPLVDYPNHLARAYILGAWDGTPELQQKFALNWDIRPYMASDATIGLLNRFLPIYDAGRVFILFVLLLFTVATVTLHKVLYGRISALPVIVYLFLFNHALFWGFLSYLCGAALAILAFAGWIHFRTRSPWYRIALFPLISLILFLSHLFGLVLYGLMVCGYEVWRVLAVDSERRRMLPEMASTAIQFITPGLLMINWIVSNQSLDKAITSYGSVTDKLTALISPVHFGMPAVDYPIALFVGLLLVWMRGQKGVVFAPELRYPVVLLIICAVAMPHVLSDVWLMDIRLPLVAACLFAAGIRFDRSQVRAERNIVAIVAALVVVRSVFIAYAWQPIDKNFDEFRAASNAIPSSAKILVVQDEADTPSTLISSYAQIYWHIGALAIIERSAFYPHLFTGHTNVDVIPSLREIDTPSGTPLSRKVLVNSIDPAKSRFQLGQRLSSYISVFWVGWPNTFDHVLSVRFGNEANPAPEYLDPVVTGSFFDLFRIKPSREREP